MCRAFEIVVKGVYGFLKEVSESVEGVAECRCTFADFPSKASAGATLWRASCLPSWILAAHVRGMGQALVRSRQTTCAFVHLPARRGEAAPTLPPPRAGLVEVLRFARAMSSAESSSARPSVRRAAMAAEKSLAPQPRCDA